VCRDVKCNIASKMAIIYVTYLRLRSNIGATERSAPRREASYFLLAFFGFACFFFGVNGFGGVFSIRRSTSSSEGDLSSFIVFPRGSFNVSVPCLL
jgi:hypothetical protein